MARFLCCVIGLVVALQQATAQQKPILNPVFEFAYYVHGEGGANGLTVTYNNHNDYYYCIQAGNADFPLEVFTGTGLMVHSTTAKADTRGFWYNPQSKCLEGTKYVSGAFIMFIDNTGLPSNPVMVGTASEFVPPTEQTQVVCNVKKKEMYAYHEGFIHVYSRKTYKPKKKIALQKSPVSWDYINPYAMIYTGMKNYEFGLYDVVNAQILLFNAKGIFTQAIQMPIDAPYVDVFRLGYANNRIFLYEGDSRAWYCYPIFEDKE